MPKKGETSSDCGRKQNQRFKAYLIFQILLRETDDKNTLSAKELEKRLSDWGVDGERHSIYQDIKAINAVHWLIRHRDKTIDDAVEAIEKDTFGKEKIILYDEKKKGFYIQPKDYSVEQIQLLAESIYTTKFLTQGDSDELAKFVCGFVSKYQAERIQHDALLTDRVRTNNKKVLANIRMLNMAMENNPKEGSTPQKVNFKYLSYTLNGEQVEKRKGERFVVSPYQLIIFEGNYYLLAFTDKRQKIQTFRVDRIDDIRMENEPREGKEAFLAFNAKEYVRQVFGMYDGERRRVKIRFIRSLLNAVYERFGKSAVYTNEDAHHFIISTEVRISPQFFGWLLGFGTGAELLGDAETVEKFTAYMDKIRKKY